MFRWAVLPLILCLAAHASEPRELAEAQRRVLVENYPETFELYQRKPGFPLHPSVKEAQSLFSPASGKVFRIVLLQYLLARTFCFYDAAILRLTTKPEKLSKRTRGEIFYSALFQAGFYTQSGLSDEKAFGCAVILEKFGMGDYQRYWRALPTAIREFLVDFEALRAERDLPMNRETAYYLKLLRDTWVDAPR